jgi:hypothetical protein
MQTWQVSRQVFLRWHSATSKKLIMNFFDVLVIATSKKFNVAFLTKDFTC